MVPTLADVAFLAVSLAVPLAFVLLSMPPFLGYLRRQGRVSEDAHKSPPIAVPEPAGPILFLGVAVGELVVYLAFGSLVPVAIMAVAAIAFVIGFVDDLYVLGGRTKPLLLLLAASPLLLILFQPDLYTPVLTFPLLGDTNPHLSIYTALAIIGMPIVANAFNMMDSFNGQISWFTLLSSVALLFGVALHWAYADGFSTARLAAVLPLVAVAAAFLVFNRYPSKAFDGDSGSLMFGAMFAALAITGGVEVAAVIAILPAILNSFYTLSSVRGFVERRRMGARPTYLGTDGLLHASVERSAPATLIRLILLSGPQSEKDLVRSVVALTLVGCLLSAAISILTWVY